MTRTIQENYERVQAQIAAAAQSVGRSAGEVRLVVVTKGHPIETVQAVVSAGACCLGENYVEDALPKVAALAGSDAEWHMIGHVQSRKARPVSENFDWIHSLDSYKLARRLSNFCGNLARSIQVLLECNVSGETSKYGWPTWDEARWTEFADSLEPLMELPNLKVRGLMTMAPFDPDPENARPYFAKLHRLRDFLVKRFPHSNWEELSMGMSGDFQVAVQEGATMVRVGTAIVGPRR